MEYKKGVRVKSINLSSENFGKVGVIQRMPSAYKHGVVKYADGDYGAFLIDDTYEDIYQIMHDIKRNS